MCVCIRNNPRKRDNQYAKAKKLKNTKAVWIWIWIWIGIAIEDMRVYDTFSHTYSHYPLDSSDTTSGVKRIFKYFLDHHLPRRFRNICNTRCEIMFNVVMRCIEYGQRRLPTPTLHSTAKIDFILWHCIG